MAHRHADTGFSREVPLPDLYYDPYDYEIDAAPHATWRRMRDQAPLYRNVPLALQDVLDASIDHET